MNSDTLFDRPSLAGSALSLLIPVPAAETELHSLIERGSALLNGRAFARRSTRDWAAPMPASRPDEIVLLLMKSPSAALPARHKGARIRWLVVDCADSGSALRKGISACQHPLVLLSSARLDVTPIELREAVELIERADVVIGWRPRRLLAWLAAPIDWLIAQWFGVSVADPSSPLRLFRRNAVDGIVLETSGRLLDVELMAKMTYLSCLMDELAAPSAGQRSSLFGALCWSGLDMIRLAVSPHFWDYSSDRHNLRPVLSEAVAYTRPTKPIPAPGWRSLAPPRLGHLGLPPHGRTRALRSGRDHALHDRRKGTMALSRRRP